MFLNIFIQKFDNISRIIVTNIFTSYLLRLFNEYNKQNYKKLLNNTERVEKSRINNRRENAYENKC